MNITPKVAQAASVLLRKMTPAQAAHDCKLTAQAAGFTTKDLERTRELCLKLARLEGSDPQRAAEWRQTVERIAETGSALVPAPSPGDTVVCVDDAVVPPVASPSTAGWEGAETESVRVCAYCLTPQPDTLPAERGLICGGCLFHIGGDVVGCADAR